MATISAYDDYSTIGLIIKVPIDVMDGLQQIATANEADIHDIIIDYVKEGIQQNMPMTKRSNFFTQTKGLLKRHNVQQESINEFVEKFTY